MIHLDADFAGVGSGFAGSITAMALAGRGHRVVMIERGRHPRFAIGESATPLTNLLLEELATAGVRPEGLEVVPVTLEEAFLRLTERRPEA